MKAEYFGHTAEGRPWELLEDHLNLVSRLAAGFAEPFNSEAWAALAGLWHDLGKYSREFQDYLSATTHGDAHTDELTGKVDHSTAGAQHAVAQDNRLGRILAHLIAGHHAGLLDFTAPAGAAALERRLTKEIPSWLENCPNQIAGLPLPQIPDLGRPESRGHAAFRVAFWLRMLFSALVDADYLATEAFMDPERAAARASESPSLEALETQFDDYLSRLVVEAIDSPINHIRTEVLESCRQGAVHSPGFFELNVPTGGGKTLSSMAFALRHAYHHGLRRVIVAVPFTSIIEQNAAVYRHAFASLGEDALLEHHSNLEPLRETTINRMRSQNWDSPVIVTTNVQFFESLFANRTSRCRKLHRIARSVIVLDEVQALPIDLLKPTLWALRELVDLYGCSVVLCSATQPALSRREDFKIGIPGVRSLTSGLSSRFELLRRVKVYREGQLDDATLASRLIEHDQVLCIVNTRRHAAALAALLGPSEGHHHLSTLMCPAHRLRVLGTIRDRLKKGLTCRVVSTQLVEAGVDLDFPAVYRASCGLDSLVQAAGRCNREGKLDFGKVFAFDADSPPPPGHLRQTADTGAEILERFDDPISPEAIEAYFQLHYWLKSDRWDHRNVLAAVGNQPGNMAFQFREMASAYRFIPQEGADIVIPWGDEGCHLIDRMKSPMPLSRAEWKQLQRGTVHLHQRHVDRLAAEGSIEPCQEQWVLIDVGKYDECLGLVLDHARSEEDWIV